MPFPRKCEVQHCPVDSRSRRRASRRFSNPQLPHIDGSFRRSHLAEQAPPLHHQGRLVGKMNRESSIKVSATSGPTKRQVRGDTYGVRVAIYQNEYKWSCLLVQAFLLAGFNRCNLRGVLPSTDVQLSTDFLNSQSVIPGRWHLVAGEEQCLCLRSRL